MSNYDFYLIENSKVPKNLLNITEEAELDLAETEYANVGMMILYDSGFSDFSANGICTIHEIISQKKHYGIITANHIIDVISSLEPTIRRIIIWEYSE